MAKATGKFHGCAGSVHQHCGGGKFCLGFGEVAEGELGFESAETNDEALDDEEEGPVEALPDVLGKTHFAARG